MNAGLSIIIPAHNEEARLGHVLEVILASSWHREGRDEIIVVDDGSNDGTATIGQWYADRFSSVRLIRNQTNRGKGYSVRRGFLEARGQVVVFTDADLSAPISEAKKLLEALERGFDIAVGSRVVDRAHIQVQRSKFRACAARLFRVMVWLILGLPVKDTQCGLKAFDRARTQSLFAQQRVERYAFDAELLFLARKRNLRVAEIGINWREDHRSKVRVLADGGRMVVDLLRIRWWWSTGAYS